MGSFTWGVGTSAYQIEGGREDGKGDSIWDTFTAARGLEDGTTACDHYHRYPEDIALMSDLGVDAYRFSIAWARVLPTGGGTVNQAGLDFYRRLVEQLLTAGIQPWVTLYHWDLPQALQDRGGWPERWMADAFTEYALVVADALGDTVRHWITHNEPWVAAMLGHQEGVFAPGIADWRRALAAGHHILLSHGQAARELRRSVPGSSIGIALDCRPARPLSDDPADVAACRHFDGYRNRWFFDPVFGRGYPEDMIDVYMESGRLDHHLIQPGDFTTIAAPIDFLGLNYYTSLRIGAGHEETEDTGIPQGAPALEGHTEMGWPNTPEALTGYLQHITDTYRPASIVITENGASYSDRPDDDDARRIDYLSTHIDAVMTAREAGVPVDGYFVWSLLDNLEWTSGFAQRFGLVWVDHETGERTPKPSYRWFRRMLETTAVDPPSVAE
jgi:beta-glucosidase